MAETTNINAISIRQAKSDDGRPIEAFAVSSPSVTYHDNVSASTDPFAGKTNKYAESRLISIVSDALYHIRMGASDVGTAVTTDFAIPPNTLVYIAVDPANPYLRVIPNTGTQDIWVTEIY